MVGQRHVARQPLEDRRLALAAAGGEALGEDLRRRGHQHAGETGIARGSIGPRRAGDVDDDDQAAPEPELDLAADAIAESMALPSEREQPRRAARRKLCRAQRYVILAAGIRWPGDVAMTKNDARRIDARPHISDERILARARRAHDRDQTAAHRRRAGTTPHPPPVSLASPHAPAEPAARRGRSGGSARGTIPA